MKLDLDALEATLAAQNAVAWFKRTPTDTGDEDGGFSVAAMLKIPELSNVCEVHADCLTEKMADAILALPALIARVRELEAQVEEHRLGDIQMGKQWNGLQDCIVKLEAENARFREALTKIDELEDCCNEASSEQALIAMHAIKEPQP